MRNWDTGGAGPQPEPLVVTDLPDLLAAKVAPREPILSPIIVEKSLSMVHAWRGTGKTHFAMGISHAIATGQRFMRWTAPRPRKVVYLDGELPQQRVQEQFAAIVAAGGEPPASGMLRVITPDLQNGPMPCLATTEGQLLVDEALEADTALIVVDSISTLVRHTLAENDAESWGSVAEWALRHRRLGRSILFVHHAGKSGAQRGTSKREDILDLVLCLKRPIDYAESEGARFEVHFEKARTLYGDSVEPFEAMLTRDSLGVQAWALKDVAVVDDERVVTLWEQGLTASDIVRETMLHKSNVSRRLTRAQKEGKLTRAYPDASKHKKKEA